MASSRGDLDSMPSRTHSHEYTDPLSSDVTAAVKLDDFLPPLLIFTSDFHQLLSHLIVAGESRRNDRSYKLALNLGGLSHACMCFSLQVRCHLVSKVTPRSLIVFSDT